MPAPGEEGRRGERATPARSSARPSELERGAARRRAPRRAAAAAGGSRSAARPPTIAPDAPRGQHGRPGAGAAELLLRDDRAEDGPAADEHEVRDAEQEHRRPEPCVPRELLPPFASSRKKPAPSLWTRAGDPDRREQRRGDEERRRVDRERDARASGHDEDRRRAPGRARRRRSATAPAARSPAGAATARHGLRHEADLGGDHETVAERRRRPRARRATRPRRCR